MTSYNDLLKFASRNSGRVITKEITFLKKCKSIKFECSEGHRWEVVSHKALNSSWCPTCNGTKVIRNTIEMMQEIALKRGGKCLSKVYKNSESKLEWECSEGHRWFASAHGVKNKGSWCKVCNWESQKNTLEDMHVLAKKRGGKCIADEYILNNVPIEWQCSEGHRWFAQPSNVTSGEWCPHCKKESEKLTIEEMQEIAIANNGRCLSKEYVTGKVKLEWQCEKGHRWWAKPMLVKHHGSWCPHCAKNRKKTIFEVKLIAQERGGKLISDEYINSKEPMKWQCSEGHEFERKLTEVLHRGRWCKECKKNKNKNIKKKAA